MLGWIVLLLNVAATLFMVGVIWFVQIVHYPLMARLPVEKAVGYAMEHQRRTGWVVGPVMLLEALTGFTLLAVHPVGLNFMISIVAFLLVVFIFYRTGMIHVPQHRILGQRYDLETCQALVRSNWQRTIAWTVRGGLVLFMLTECILE
jgi:hypothetical protein